MRRMAFLVVAAASVAFITVLAAGCGNGDAVTGSGDLVTKSYDFKDFTRLDVRHDFEVEVRHGEAYEVEVTVDDNLVDSLDVSLTGDTLRIDLDGGPYVRTTQRATVTLPKLVEVTLSGSSEAAVEGFASSDDLELVLEGASSLELVELRAGDTKLDVSGASEVTGSAELGDVSMDVSGASDVELKGSGAAATLEASGASSIDLGDFTLESADVTLSGASEAKLDVVDTLDLELSGASRLSYSGDPRLGKIETGGDSKIDHTE